MELEVKNPLPRQERHKLDPWARKIPWGRKWGPTPVFMPGKSHGPRSQWAAVCRVAESDVILKRLSVQIIYSMVSTQNAEKNSLRILQRHVSCPWKAGSWGMSPNSPPVPCTPGLLLLVTSSPCFPGGSDSKECACRQETRVSSLG